MKKKVKRYDGEDGSLIEDESDRGAMTEEQQANSDATNAVAKAAAPKRVIVTKEQLAASPYDNLRDYLNAQQNLKRRDGSAPSKPAAKTSSTDRALGPNTVPKYTPPKEESKSDYKTQFQKQQEDAGKGSEAFKRVMGKVFGSKSQRSTAAEKDKTKGMAKGGTASSRGDGCAQKGHTKGRYI